MILTVKLGWCPASSVRSVLVTTVSRSHSAGQPVYSGGKDLAQTLVLSLTLWLYTSATPQPLWRGPLLRVFPLCVFGLRIELIGKGWIPTLGSDMEAGQRAEVALCERSSPQGYWRPPEQFRSFLLVDLNMSLGDRRKALSRSLSQYKLW